MLIDLILDRKDGLPYDHDTFVSQVKEYGCPPPTKEDARNDKGYELLMKSFLVSYIIEEEYNTKLIDYILSVNWT